MFGITQLCHRFNDHLNDAVAKTNQFILTMSSCNSYDHFDHRRNLSKGRISLWHELDDLIDRFERNKVKLLPNPKNPPHQFEKLKHPENRREKLHLQGAEYTMTIALVNGVTNC